MPERDREIFLLGLTPQEMSALRWDWNFWARPQQLEPPGDWMTWLVMAGRGFGKTRLGAEWVRSQVCGPTPLSPGKCQRVALVAETAADGRDVMVQGPSGILAVHPPEFRPRYVKSDRALYWPNGALALLFSAEDPEQLRGPEHDLAWCFIAETPVLLANGQEARIDRVQVGDYVQTRHGPRKVLAAGCTAKNAPVLKVTLSDGRKIIGTAKHPVWVDELGWVPLGQLKPGDPLCVTPACSGRVKPTTYQQKGITVQVQTPYTGQSLQNISALGPRDLIHTTKMKIRAILLQKIWSISSTVNIDGYTLQENHRQSDKSALHLKLRSACLQNVNTSVAFVYSAVKSFKAELWSPGSFVPDFVGISFANPRRLFHQNAGAKYAEKFTYLKNLFKGTVPESVIKKAQIEHMAPVKTEHMCVQSVEKCKTPADVYDITVEEAHEFFANGVLVHNCDESAKWNYPQETWDMLQFGMRYGDNPRQLVTTTPRPIPLVRELLKAEGKPNGTYVTRGSTFDNAANLARNFIVKIKERYEGTRLGRQELHAELLDDVPGALWSRSMFEYRTAQNPIGALLRPDAKLPQLVRVVVGLDPSGSSGEEEDNSDDIGIVVGALGSDNHYYILADATINAGPAGWARHAVYQYDEFKADCIVGERNYGGAMVEHTLRTARRSINYKDVVATRGKAVRAEPIAALYETGRVHHVHSFARLEDELCSMTNTGYLGRGSPNRVDALVWVLTELHGNQDTYDPELWARLADV